MALLLLALLAATACGASGSEPGASQRSLERYGIGITPPDGWNARMTRGTLEAATGPLGRAGQPVKLGAGEVYVRLFEFEPDPALFGAGPQELASAYASGPPRPFAAGDFGPPELGANPENAGFATRNFSLAGRYFDLFVESGAPTPSARTVDALNELVASLDVRAGDFYPGTKELLRFPPSDGWYVGSGGGGEVRATDYAAAWASTVPYRNGPNDLPPVRTLQELPADGILLWVGVSRDSRFSPTAELRRDPRPVDLPLRLNQTAGGPGFEGQPRPDIALYRLYGRVDQQYDVDLWVFFGRGEPSAEQRARAQTMLDRLEFPRWGTWELDGRGSVVSG